MLALSNSELVFYFDCEENFVAYWITPKFIPGTSQY